MTSKPFRPMRAGTFMIFAGMIGTGMCALLLTLIVLIDLLVPSAGWQRGLAMFGAAWGVLFLGGALVVLLGQVYELSKEIERLKAAPGPIQGDTGGSACEPIRPLDP